MNTEIILERLKQALSLKTDKALANYLGVGPSGISNWKKRETLDWDLIFSQCDSVDLNWLVRGETSRTENILVEVPMLKARVAQLEEQNREFLEIIKNLTAK